MKKLLIFIPLQLIAMQEAEVIVYVEPERPHMLSNEDIKRWAIMELDARDIGFTAKFRALSDKIDEHIKDNGSAHTKTRAALVATIVTTICGVTTTLVTYFTTRYANSH